MRVALTDNGKPYSGIGVYASELAAHLRRLPGLEIAVFKSEAAFAHGNFCVRAASALNMLAEDQFRLLRWLRNEQIELVHQTKNYSLPLVFGGSKVVTIHDVIPLVFARQYLKGTAARKYYELLMGMTIKSSDRVITVSHFSRQEICRYLGVEAAKIDVVHLAVSPAFRAVKEISAIRSVLAKYCIEKPFILAIGGGEYRKNNKRLIEVFLQNFANSHTLVVVGGSWRNEELWDKGGENLVLIENLAAEELAALYSGAAVFVYPSLYEGFGLPVLEAMACGAPVITSNLSALPEVAGEAAVLIDPYDSDDLKEAMKQVLASKDLRVELKGRGFARSREFSWLDTARKTAQVYLKASRKD